jgi:hypothetical protein
MSGGKKHHQVSGFGWEDFSPKSSKSPHHLGKPKTAKHQQKELKLKTAQQAEAEGQPDYTKAKDRNQVSRRNNFHRTGIQRNILHPPGIQKASARQRPSHSKI